MIIDNSIFDFPFISEINSSTILLDISIKSEHNNSSTMPGYTNSSALQEYINSLFDKFLKEGNFEIYRTK